MTTNENIFVVTPQGEQLAIEFDAADTIENFKAKIEAAQGTPAADQFLAYGGQLLEDGRALADYDIAKDTQIGLYVRTEGGNPLAIAVVGGFFANFGSNIVGNFVNDVHNGECTVF